MPNPLNPDVIILDEKRPHYSARLTCPHCKFTCVHLWPVGVLRLECGRCKNWFEPFGEENRK